VANIESRFPFRDRLKAQLWEQTKLGAKRGYSWNEAVVRWLDQYLNGVALDDINRDVVDKLIQGKLATQVSNSTVNRMLPDPRYLPQSGSGMGMAGQGAEDSAVTRTLSAYSLDYAGRSGSSASGIAGSSEIDGAV